MRRYISVVGGGAGRTYRVTRDRSSLSDPSPDNYHQVKSSNINCKCNIFIVL